MRLPQLRLGLGLAVVASLLGCAPRNKAYPGPARSPHEIAVVRPTTDIDTNTYISVLEIDDRDTIEEWRGGNAEPIELLPGEYHFRVEYTDGGSVSYMSVLLTTAYMINAAVTNLRHSDALIVFPVAAGSVHWIHYDLDAHTYSVSRRLPTDPVQLVGSRPPTYAIPCTPTPDRTQEFWCQLRS